MLQEVKENMKKMGKEMVDMIKNQMKLGKLENIISRKKID